MEPLGYVVILYAPQLSRSCHLHIQERHQPRAEEAFEWYFGQQLFEQVEERTGVLTEVYVCHANIIKYFFQGTNTTMCC